MDLMINPALRIGAVRIDDETVVRKGEKHTTNKKEGEELLERKRGEDSLWVEWDEDYALPQGIPVEEDNSEGIKDESDKED